MRSLAMEGPEAYVAGAMQREFISLSPLTDLTEAVAKLTPHACALVFDDHRLIGMLTSENLSEFLMLRQIGRVRQKFEANA
jgi:CBS domain-containing protein